MARRHTYTSRITEIQEALRSADPAEALLRLYYGLSEGGVTLFRKAFRSQLARWIADQKEHRNQFLAEDPYLYRGNALAEVSSVVLDGDIPQLRDLVLSEHWDEMATTARVAVRAALTHYRAADLCPSRDDRPIDWANLGCWEGACEYSPLRAASHNSR